MKKKYVLFLFLFLISFFGVNLKVDAAQELTCLYEKGSSHKVLLVQESSGKFVVFKNPKDKGIDDLKWYEAKAVPRWVSTSLFGWNWDSSNDPKIKEGSLVDCPKSVDVNSKGRLAFRKDKKGENELELEKKVVDKPAAVYRDYILGTNYDIPCENIPDKWITPYVEGGKYVSSCLYYKNINVPRFNGSCQVIQLNVDRNKNIYIQVTEPENLSVTNASMELHVDGITVSEFQNDYLGSCPAGLLVERESNTPGQYSVSTYYDTYVKFGQKEADGYEKYIRAECAGTNAMYPERSLCGINSSIGFIKTEKFKSCDELFGSSKDLLKIIKTIVNLFKIFIPILLVGLGALDFVKAMFSGNDDGMKKAQAKFVKRVIIALVIFLIPTMLRFVLEIAKNIWPNIDATLCGII